MIILQFYVILRGATLGTVTATVVAASGCLRLPRLKLHPYFVAAKLFTFASSSLATSSCVLSLSGR